MKLTVTVLASVMLGALALPAVAVEDASNHYERGHEVLNSAWDLEAQSIRMGYSAHAKLRYQEMAQGEYERALESFDAAIAAEPDNYAAHSIRGLVLRRIGRHEEALSAYSEALALNPDDLTTKEYRAEALVELSRLEEAKEIYFELQAANTDLARDLIAYMTMWLERPEPSHQAMLEGEKYANLRAWVAERRDVSRKLSMLSTQGGAVWE